MRKARHTHGHQALQASFKIRERKEKLKTAVSWPGAWLTRRALQMSTFFVFVTISFAIRQWQIYPIKYNSTSTIRSLEVYHIALDILILLRTCINLIT